MKDTFIIHTADLESLDGLSMEELGVLFLALMRSQREEPLPEMNRATRMAYRFMAAQIDRDNEKYQEIVEKRKAAARARWDKQKDSMQMHKVQSLSVSDSVSVSVSDSVSEYSSNIKSLSNMPDGMEAELESVYGESSEALKADVRRYYEAHPEKSFPGWPVAMAQFASNQKRWGKSAKHTSSMDDLLKEAFGNDG